MAGDYTIIQPYTLHDNARRSRSPSPFNLAAIRNPTGSPGRPDPWSIKPPPFRQPLGLVDELADPKLGHLADHPTALTAVTSTGAMTAVPLSERLVKSSSRESEDGSRDTDTDLPPLSLSAGPVRPTAATFTASQRLL